jgi:CheY-like chemotaxis protein
MEWLPETPGMKALIVDDHPAMRRLIASLLPAEWESTQCGNGREAVEAYPRTRPDCVLMDVEMPVEDGFSAARRIRAQDPAAWIVFISQHGGSAFSAGAREAGGRALVSKSDLPQLVDHLPATR